MGFSTADFLDAIGGILVEIRTFPYLLTQQATSILEKRRTKTALAQLKVNRRSKHTRQ
ncbi:hypothetical protein [cf. Phormidesmis sp. LEGE 11477]|uniref:hypothetical protein n=1 Tax=cf. Phormidesmis sp. LEGE 11477 TaxID=1828680 RepID=UPI00187E2D8E|nr:hypothetical protein [cf. Phormidesmis sp. LEGE 11477]